MRPDRARATPQDGFSLIELLVVVIIIGILAAIAVPRYLGQRQAAWDAAAVADLRNLTTVQTSLAASPAGMSEDPVVVADEGWQPSLSSVIACADVQGDDLLLAVWHTGGSNLHTWRRSDARVATTPGVVPATCAAALPGGSPTRLTP